jgi:hypothetical protein
MWKNTQNREGGQMGKQKEGVGDEGGGGGGGMGKQKFPETNPPSSVPFRNPPSFPSFLPSRASAAGGGVIERRRKSHQGSVAAAESELKLEQLARDLICCLFYPIRVEQSSPKICCASQKN